MKKLYSIMLSFVIAILCFAPKLQITYAETITDNSIIILSGNINEEKNELIIDANLTVNTGISGMTLELVYDKNVMELTNVVFGEALNSLNKEKSGALDYTPYKFIYEGINNDFSTGKLFTLTFDLKEGIKDGNYKVSLKYVKNKDVIYLSSSGEIKTKNLYINNAKIKIENNSVIEIKSIKEEENIITEKDDNNVILFISLAVVVCIIFVVFAIILLKRKRNWKRL